MGLLLSLAVFLRPLQQQAGWGRGEIAFISTLNWTVVGLVSFGAGAIADRMGTRPVVLTGGVLLGGSLLVSGFARTITQLYLSFGIIGGAAISAFYVPLTTAAARWVPQNRGIAVAIVSAGNGLGVVIFSPLTQWLIGTVGWQATFYVLAAISWAVIIPAGLLISDAISVERFPKVKAPETHRTPTPGELVREGMRSRTFRRVALVHFLCCASHSGLMLHMVSHAIDHGIPALVASSMFSVAAMLSLARIYVGWIADLFGPKRTLLVMLTLQTGTLATYLIFAAPVSFWILGGIFGLSYGSLMPLYPLLIRQHFHSHIMGTMYGGVFLISCIAMGLGGYVGGVFYDHFGSYVPMFVLGVGLGLWAILVASRIPPDQRSRANARGLGIEGWP